MRLHLLLVPLLAWPAIGSAVGTDTMPASCTETAAAGCAAPAAAPAASTAAAATDAGQGPAHAGTGAAPPFNTMGNPDAPVAIVEYSDLQCPFCARFELQVFPQVRRAYIDTGKVFYAAVAFPLPMHAYAVPAAVAARCAGAQGKFWEFRDAVFAEQTQLARDPYDAIAQKLGLDLAQFSACRQDERQEAAVREEFAEGGRFGVHSTPSFVLGRLVNGSFQSEMLSGALSFEDFAARIDTLLEAGQETAPAAAP
jgi:protein-disulfide isomerase